MNQCREAINGNYYSPVKNGESLESPSSIKKARHGSNTSVFRSSEGSLLNKPQPMEKHF